MREHANDITARLDRLERENRRLKRVGGGLAIAVAALGLMSAASGFCKTVWAERLVLRDSSGNDRLMMDAYSSGVPSITMRDGNGKSVARLSWKDGIQVDMLDAKGSTRACTRIDREGKVTTTREGEEDVVSMAR